MGETTVPSVAAAPARGTRPGNRRELLLDSAAELFRDKGFHRVSMKDVAVANNVAPSSLYAHFSGKQELLHDAIARQMDPSFRQVYEHPMTSLADLAEGLAEGTLQSRAFGVLWQREARNLDAEARLDLRHKLSAFHAVTRDVVQQHRPELSAPQAMLLVHCAMAAITSISFHRIDLPVDIYRSLLADLCLRLLTLDPPTVEVPRRQGLASTPADRKQQIIDAAIPLFARRGFAVSMDDIGAAVAMTGPSVYKHVRNKQELLAEAFLRGQAQFQASLEGSLSGDPAEDLERITHNYVELAIQHAETLTVLIAELNQLEPERQRQARLDQRRYVLDWVDVALRATPGDPIITRVKVQAAQMVAINIARTPHLHQVPQWRATVHEACSALQA